METEVDFDALVARVGQGDLAALTKLVLHYEKDLRIAARVRLGPELRPYLDSMDLVQSVYAGMLREVQANQFAVADADEFLARAVGAIKKKIAHHWRHLRRQQRLDGKPDTGPIPELLLSLTDAGDDPAQTAQMRDQIEYLYRQLDREDQQFMGLRLDGYTTAEAAALMAVDPATLRKRHKRLREHFRDIGLEAEFI